MAKKATLRAPTLPGLPDMTMYMNSPSSASIKDTQKRLRAINRRITYIQQAFTTPSGENSVYEYVQDVLLRAKVKVTPSGKIDTSKAAVVKIDSPAKTIKFLETKIKSKRQLKKLGENLVKRIKAPVEKLSKDEKNAYNRARYAILHAKTDEAKEYKELKKLAKDRVITDDQRVRLREINANIRRQAMENAHVDLEKRTKLKEEVKQQSSEEVAAYYKTILFKNGQNQFDAVYIAYKESISSFDILDPLVRKNLADDSRLPELIRLRKSIDNDLEVMKANHYTAYKFQVETMEKMKDYLELVSDLTFSNQWVSDLRYDNTIKTSTKENLFYNDIYIDADISSDPGTIRTINGQMVNVFRKGAKMNKRESAEKKAYNNYIAENAAEIAEDGEAILYSEYVPPKKKYNAKNIKKLKAKGSRRTASSKPIEYDDLPY